MKNELENIVYHVHTINKEHRRLLNQHKSYAIWITGLPAAGKSTIANTLECRLHWMGIRTYILDGDNIRYGLNRGLGFSQEDRRENIRRIAEIIKLFVDAGVVIIAAFISPYRNDRLMARQLLEPGEFIEVYAKCPLEECERRDPKDLYKKARMGKIQNFTGLTAPYEEPENPEIILYTNKYTVKQAASQIITYLFRNNYLKRGD